MGIFQYVRDAWERRNMPMFTVPERLMSPALAPELMLRPLRYSDEDEWMRVHEANAQWLAPWESEDPLHGPGLTFAQWIRMLRRGEREGTGVVFGMFQQGRLIGQISLGAISYGSMREGIVGYWIDRNHAGRGLTPLAVCIVADWALFYETGPLLHRLEIDIVPSNQRSQSVAHKVGAIYEGVRRQYMYIRGEWKGHECYSLISSDAPGGFTARLLGDTRGEKSHMLS
ncbi:GNAT family N-acetyltransferase [Bifidobacterium magnum]|nr:GNAT family protein [Bifidobacterium magnum]